MKHQLRTTDPIHIYNSEFNEHFTWVWITIDVSKSTKNNIKFKFSFLLGTFKNVLVSHCSCEIFKRICNRFSKQIEIWYVYEDFEIIACIKDPIIDFFSAAYGKVRSTVIFLQLFMKIIAKTLGKKVIYIISRVTHETNTY